MSARSLWRRGPLARAFTLVEMLVAMVLTLIMVAAIAEFYARVGDSVKDGRAMIEMSSQLRNAVTRLKTDLDLLTLSVGTVNDDGAGSGYYENNEGAATDNDVNGNVFIDPAILIAPIAAGLDSQDGDAAGAGGAGTPDWLEPNVTNLLGDADDWMGFTCRAGDTPWVGQRVGVDPNSGLLVTQSANVATAPPSLPPPSVSGGNLSAVAQTTAPYAEIIWWTAFTDTDLDGRWDLNEPRFIVRRQLLIRPDLNVLHPGDGNVSVPYFVRIATATDFQVHDLFQDCDISLRLAITNLNGYDYYVANNLSDLTKRENRYMHISGSTFFPNPLDLAPRVAGGRPADNVSLSNAIAGSQYRWLLRGRRRGEDIVLSNVMAFDVRVYDPSASLRPDIYGAAVNLLTPGDPAYADTLVSQMNNTMVNQAAGLGAYVDLGYGSLLQLRLQNAPYSLSATQAATAASYAGNYFAFQSRYSGQLNAWATYDTWSASYERDGLNQDWAADGVANINTAPFDEGTNGLDDDGINGVDDNGEKETLPPFPRPLRGVQIKIRTYEPGSRQTRQATVAADFITE